ncbi:hypothetical protein AB0M42_05775 [Streptomyces sp. NPDC051784]|uniref:hypothetical protein n=1 Tax=Streptomyces sp. NPDC051784 TaxID=3155805 RepID=UPI0034235116
MSSSKHNPYREFRLVEQYDSFEDPWSRSEFLDAIGKTRQYIDALRARRDAARETDRVSSAEPTSELPLRGGPGRPRTRTPRRRAAVRRPPNKTGIRYATRRRAARTVLLVIVIRRG